MGVWNEIGILMVLCVVHILMIENVDLLGLLLLLSQGRLMHLHSHVSINRIDSEHLVLLLRVLRLNSCSRNSWLNDWLSQNLLSGLEVALLIKI